MTRIVTDIVIERPVEAVFDYVTTPSNWPQWHPSSVGVDSAAGRSLDVGEQVREAIKVGWQRDRVQWTVLERERPRRWVIEGRGETGGAATLRYELGADGARTRFRRDLTYRMPNAFLGVIDRLLVRHIMAVASRSALARLKRALEVNE
jgi:uncharacterized protein YndB with AHSA1/START domain